MPDGSVDGVAGLAEGDEVVIVPALGWGGGEDGPAPGFRILGGPDDGTYAELVRLPAENVLPQPARLSWEESAALPLAGLTAYRALVEPGADPPGRDGPGARHRGRRGDDRDDARPRRPAAG